MKHSLDNQQLLDALKHASEALNELRTSALTPKEYYDLYVTAVDQLRFLEAFLYDESIKNDRKVSGESGCAFFFLLLF